MLQIDIEGCNPAELIFSLRGSLDGVGVDALIRDWNEHTVAGEDRNHIVDVSGVTCIDAVGESAIRYLASAGARFRVSGPMVDKVIDLVCKEKDRALQNGYKDFSSIVFCLRP